jgi:esterase/lipase superfamily enzyme
MVGTRETFIALLTAAILVTGCASKPRQLMPTPVIYQEPSPIPAVVQAEEARTDSTDVDLLFITDRAPETNSESTLPYGETRSKSIAFGSARVRIGPGVTWDTLERESRLAERTRDLDLSLGDVTEIGRFPQEPYELDKRAAGIFRDATVMRQHESAKQTFRNELRTRLARSKNKEIVLYVHGFNETFATAAFTAAELCHYLGRESVCVFFTWPASSSGDFLTSYTSTTETARYAEDHLRKMIRSVASTPGVESLHLLAHSRGTAVLMSSLRSLFTEVIAAGKEPRNVLRIDNIVLFSPDIDVDLFAQDITAGFSDPDMYSVWPNQRLPNALRGRLTVYSSPMDRALFVSRILFRSETRVGNIRAEDVPERAQRYLEPFDKVDIIVFEGKRTDTFGHSYFTTNPRVSSDLIQLLRYDRKPGEPGRELLQVGPVAWKFPSRKE